MISKKPSTEEIDYGAAFTVGDYEHLRGEGFVNIPFSDKAALRVTGARETRDPYVENTLIGDSGGLKDADNWYVRGQFSFEFSEDLSVLLRAEHWQDDANGNASFGYKVLGVPINLATGLTNGVSGTLRNRIGRSDECTGTCGRAGAGFDFTATPGLDTAQPTNSDPFEIARDFEPQRDIKEDTLAAEINWRGLGFADVKINVSYMDYSELRLGDTDLSGFPSIIAGNDITSETTTQEIQLTSSHDGPLQWVAGLYFLQEDLTNAFLWMDISTLVDNAPDPAADPIYTWASWMRQIRLDTRSHAAYSQGTYSLLDERMRIIGGIRYTYDKRGWDIFGPGMGSALEGAFAADLSALSFNTPSLENSRQSWNKITWKAGIEWDINDDAMIYFTTSTGFLSGNAQGAFNGAGNYDERLVDAYELGLKSTLLDGAMRFNLAAYYNDYADLLSTSFVDVGGTTLAFSDNAGAAHAFGVELEVDWTPIERLSLGLRAAYTSAEYDEFILTNVFEEGGSTINGVANLFSLDGAEIIQSPDITATLLAAYDFDLGDKGTLTPSVAFYYSDDYRNADAPFFFGVQESFTKTDLALGWTSLNGYWNAQAYVHNLEDEEIMLDATRFGGNVAIADFAPPRTFGFRMGYRF